MEYILRTEGLCKDHSRVASCCSRILYLLDGQIQGELSLEDFTHESIRQREERVNKWLTTMEW